MTFWGYFKNFLFFNYVSQTGSYPHFAKNVVHLMQYIDNYTLALDIKKDALVFTHEHLWNYLLN